MEGGDDSAAEENADLRAEEASDSHLDSHLDLGRAPYALYGVTYIDLVSLAPFSGGDAD